MPRAIKINLSLYISASSIGMWSISSTPKLDAQILQCDENKFKVLTISEKQKGDYPTSKSDSFVRCQRIAKTNESRKVCPNELLSALFIGKVPVLQEVFICLSSNLRILRMT
jgi:hypothetical protein